MHSACANTARRRWRSTGHSSPGPRGVHCRRDSWSRCAKRSSRRIRRYSVRRADRDVGRLAGGPAGLQYRFEVSHDGRQLASGRAAIIESQSTARATDPPGRDRAGTASEGLEQGQATRHRVARDDRGAPRRGLAIGASPRGPADQRSSTGSRDRDAAKARARLRASRGRDQIAIGPPPGVVGDEEHGPSRDASCVRASSKPAPNV